MKRLAKHTVTGNFITPQTVLQLIRSNYKEYFAQIEAGELTFASTKDSGLPIGNAFQGFFIVNKDEQKQWLIELYQFNSKTKDPILFVVDATAQIPNEAAANPAWKLNEIKCIPSTTARQYFNESKNKFKDNFCATDKERLDKIAKILTELKENDQDGNKQTDNVMSKSARRKRLIKRW